MKVGDIVRFKAGGRHRLDRHAPHLYPYKYELGIVTGYFRGTFNDPVETVGPNGDTALKVVFPSKVGEFRRSCLELVSAAG